MKSYWLAVKAEMIKLKRNLFFPIHILIPLAGAVLLFLYLKNTGWEEITRLSIYLTIITGAFPFMISIVTAISVQMEEENGFLWMLQAPDRKKVLFAKLFVLNIMGDVAAALALVFAPVLGIASFSGIPAFKLFFVICLPNVILYAFHMMLSLKFGKSISVFLGICGTIISILFLTGLGDGIWKFVPGSMANRACNEILSLRNPALAAEAPVFAADLSGFWGICGVEIVLIILFLAVWFSRWEGRKVYE